MTSVKSEGISIVFNEDGVDWKDYLAEAIRNEENIPNLLIQFDQDEMFGKQFRENMKVVLVIFSPGHREFLMANLHFDYSNIVQCPSTAVVMFCGTEVEEIHEKDSTGKPLTDRFPEFSKWNQSDTTKCDDLPKLIKELLLKPFIPYRPPVKRETLPDPLENAKSKQYKARLTNQKAKCEEPTTIPISFGCEISAEAVVEVTLVDVENEGDTLALPTDRLNPYTYLFTAPEHLEGSVEVEVKVDGQKVSVNPSVLNYVSQVDQFVGFSQIYIELMVKMIECFQPNTSTTTQLDNKMSSLFELTNMDSNIPSEAFEKLFGIHRFASTERSEMKYPTLLHFAANFGLKEFCSKLSDLPDSNLALSITNGDGQVPGGLAKKNRHDDLADYLQNMKEIELDDIYVTRETGDLGKSQKVGDDGYIKARIRHAKTTGYITMHGRGVIAATEPDDEYTVVPQTNQPTPTPRQTQGQPGGNTVSRRTNDTNTTKQRKSRVSSVYSTRAPVVCALPSMSRPDDVVDIINMFKSGELTIGQTEMLFNEWRARNIGGKSGSFQQKQDWLKRMKQELTCAKNNEVSKSNRSSAASERSSRTSTSSGYNSGVETDPDSHSNLSRNRHQRKVVGNMAPPLPPRSNRH